MDAVRRSYDTIAAAYIDRFGGELAGKPVDRAMLAALVELVGDGPMGDVGCGPGHLTAYLTGLGPSVEGIDLSPEMIAIARRRHPDLRFTVADLTNLPVPDGTWAGALCSFSIIHLDRDGRARAYAELARVVRPGGWLLISFHTAHLDLGIEPGGTLHLDELLGHRVDLRYHLLDPADVADGLTAAGFNVFSRTEREPHAGVEAPSRRAYLLARRDQPG
jgi:SAM-dependent methyltransferase